MANRPAFIRLAFHLIHPVIFNGNSLRKEFLDLLYDFNKAVHFGLGVVKIKTRAGGGFHAELVHERLRAVMPAAQGHTRLVRQRHHVVRVNVLQQKTHEAGAAW